MFAANSKFRILSGNAKHFYYDRNTLLYGARAACHGELGGAGFERMVEQLHRYSPQGPDHTLTGNFRMHPDFESSFLSRKRHLLVYLPPEYEQNPSRRYPVLYLHDGQNLFDGATAYVKGEDWGVDETVEKLIIEREIEPLIVVGIYNTGDQRLDEYTPSRDSRIKRGGSADLYGRLLVEELKPFIDERYRTRPGPGQTGLGGSSLGGLVSLYLGLRYPIVFGKLLVMSPSIWWDRGEILRYINKLPVKPSTRIWLDIGTLEENRSAKMVRSVRDALKSRGWRQGDDLEYFEARGGQHNERAWRERVEPALRFLFPYGSGDKR